MSPKSFEAVWLKFCRDVSCLDFCFPPRFPSRSHFYFGHQGSCRDSRKHPGEILAAEKLLPGENLDGEILAAGILASRRDSRQDSRRDFGRGDFCFPVRFPAGSRRDFGRREFRFPARILPGSCRDSRREKKSRRPKSCRDPGGIPVEIAPGSR